LINFEKKIDKRKWHRYALYIHCIIIGYTWCLCISRLPIKEITMAKVAKKTIKKEIKARKAKIQKQEGKLKKLKKSLKKA